MNKKKVIMSILIIILILIPIYLVTRPIEEIPEEESDVGIYYSEYAGDWIEPVNETVSINIREATEGQSDYILGQQRYVDIDGSIKALFYEGSYKGEYFTTAYEDAEGNVKMAIYKEMNPTDGIIEGFALIKKEDGSFVLYLFVDDDWKKESKGNINIIWGNDLNDNEVMHSRKFDFSNEKNGVYFDKITEDLEFATEQITVTGGLFLGELSFEDFKNDNFEGKTFIFIS